MRNTSRHSPAASLKLGLAGSLIAESGPVFNEFNTSTVASYGAEDTRVVISPGDVVEHYSLHSDLFGSCILRIEPCA